MPDPVALDPGQREVATIDPDVRQVVIAPAGTGKTETVAALVEHLVDEIGLEPAHEILVLSFSRAAVSAVRRRFSRDDRPLPVNVRTLDALASRIIAEADADEDPAASFDGRIAQATRFLREGHVPEELEVVEHVVVDEVQDVVGARAEFVLEVLRAVDGGFTILGDPHQAIYNFQLPASGGVTSERLLEFVDQRYAPRLIRLTTNYRAGSDEARRFAAVGARLEGLDAKRRVDLVRAETASLVEFDDLDEVVSGLARWPGESTALLCRTNGLAMVVHEQLRARGIRASLQSSAEQRGVSAWVARCVGDDQTVRRDDFVVRYEGPSSLPAAEAWRLLKRAERDYASGDRLDVRRLARAVALRDVPAELLEPAESEITVSTVHRSKGLEFDNVVLVGTDGWLPADATGDDASEAYVALTRARRRVFSVRVDPPRGLRRDPRSERWVIQGFKRGRTFGMELRPADTRRPDDPAREPEIGEHLLERSAPGDAVTLTLNRELSDLDRPIYDVRHDSVRIGMTTEEFGEAMGQRLGSVHSRGRWPTLVGLRVDGYETRGAGPEYAASGLRHLWLGAVITGMARFEWERDEG